MEDTSEWMFGDCAQGMVGIHFFAELNPFRWSGSQTMQKTIKDLKELPDKDKKRPIILKVPAGPLSHGTRVENVSRALEMLEQPFGVQVEWRWGDAGDAGEASPGFDRLAKLNPLSWSDTKTIDCTVDDLCAVTDAERARPVVLKIPAGLFTPEKRCESVEAAIEVLNRAKTKSKEWKPEQALILERISEKFNSIQRLEGFNSVLKAVDELNSNEDLCSSGACIVFSSRVNGHVLLYRSDMYFRSDELAKTVSRLRTGTGCWKTKGNRTAGSGDYQFGDFTKSVLLRRGTVLGSLTSCVPQHFDSNKLVMAQSDQWFDQRYDKGGQLGAGAQGVAHLLTRKHTGQEYVAKEAKQGNHDDIKKEFANMRDLRHPNCVKLVEFLEASDGDVCTICEFARGGDLCKYMQEARKEGTLPESVVRGIFTHAMRGVAFLHQSACVHNDLKPDNFLCIEGFDPSTPEGVPRVVVTDYGLLRTLEQMKNSFICGDLRYMSPDLWSLRFGDDQDHTEFQKDDIWAMGIMLHELLTTDGSLPGIGRPVAVDELLVHTEDCQGGLTPEGKFCFDEKCPACQMTKQLQDLAHGECLPVFDKITAGPEAIELLSNLLCKTTATRPNFKAVLNNPWLTASAPTSLGNLEFAAQPDNACQVLLNVVMWRLRHDEEVNKCYNAFCLFDKDYSGRVKRQRFEAAFRNEHHFSVKRVFDMGDVDGNESLDFNEFATLCFNWKAMEKETLGKHIHELFVDIGNAEGQVDLPQLGNFFGEAVTESDLETLFRRLGVASTSCLTSTAVQEFILQNDATRTLITWNGSFSDA